MITLRPPGQPDLSLEFMIDTGFTEFLTLPPAAVVALRLPLLYERRMSLADGSAIMVPVHQARIVWDGQEQQVSVLATGRRPLLGTALLDDQELRVQFREGGMVTTKPL